MTAPAVPSPPVVVSGMRPTGRLHLGHLLGTLRNWVALQDDHRCHFFVADWHVLTTDYEKPRDVQGFVEDMVLDWLAAGIDPERSVIFRQSAILEHAELALLFGMFTPVPWLERNPTYKEQREQLVDRDLSTYGFLGYPVLQAADILLYKAHGVPVGVDQAPHVELTREIARRFNHLYGEVFPEPQTARRDRSADCSQVDVGAAAFDPRSRRGVSSLGKATVCSSRRRPRRAGPICRANSACSALGRCGPVRATA